MKNFASVQKIKEQIKNYLNKKKQCSNDNILLPLGLLKLQEAQKFTMVMIGYLKYFKQNCLFPEEEEIEVYDFDHLNNSKRKQLGSIN